MLFLFSPTTHFLSLFFVTCLLGAKNDEPAFIEVSLSKPPSKEPSRKMRTISFTFDQISTYKIPILTDDPDVDCLSTLEKLRFSNEFDKFNRVFLIRTQEQETTNSNNQQQITNVLSELQKLSSIFFDLFHHCEGGDCKVQSDTFFNLESILDFVFDPSDTLTLIGLFENLLNGMEAFLQQTTNLWPAISQSQNTLFEQSSFEVDTVNSPSSEEKIKALDKEMTIFLFNAKFTSLLTYLNQMKEQQEEENQDNHHQIKYSQPSRNHHFIKVWSIKKWFFPFFYSRFIFQNSTTNQTSLENSAFRIQQQHPQLNPIPNESPQSRVISVFEARNAPLMKAFLALFNPRLSITIATIKEDTSKGVGEGGQKTNLTKAFIEEFIQEFASSNQHLLDSLTDIEGLTRAFQECTRSFLQKLLLKEGCKLEEEQLVAFTSLLPPSQEEVQKVKWVFIKAALIVSVSIVAVFSIVWMIVAVGEERKRENKSLFY